MENENIFFARFHALCKKHGTTVNAVGRLLGFSSGSLTAWKQGTEPRSGAVTRIAEYFGVTADYLLGLEEPQAPDLLDEVDVAWYGDYQTLSQEQKQTIRDMVTLMRQRRSN